MQIGTTREMLERVVALLLSMADLAERAAFAPQSVRFLVLWALFRADTVATDFVLETASLQGRQWTPAVPPSARAFEPDDAIALATSLRTLAMVLRTLAALLPDLPFGDDFAGAGWAERPHSAIGGDAFIESGTRGYPAEPFDTS